MLKREVAGEDGDEIVGVYIDGRSLVDLVREVEVVRAAEDGQPELAGLYRGLHPEQWADLPEQYGDGRATVLACECGEVGCWPLRVRITVSDATVVWSDFQQPYREGWSYEGLGPFTFARDRYDEAVSNVA